MRLPTAEAAHAHFVPTGVARLIEAGLSNGPERVEKAVAVLFVDIVGCSRLCEELPPQTMQALIESHFSTFFDVVQDRRGMVNEIMGDGFMAVFEFQALGANTEDALSAAYEILLAAARHRAVSEHDTQVRIGLHAGTALVGVTRFRSKAGERWTYTASGPTTNTAARLCQLAEPGTAVVSNRVVELAGGRFQFDDLGVVSLKNMRHPLGVARLVTAGRIAG